MSSLPTISDNTSITLTTRHDRSILTALLHILIRPFRTRLNSSQPNISPGSPPLTPLKSIITTHRTICSINIYDIHPPNSTSTLKPSSTKNRIYYIAGGSWQQPPTSQHWWLCNHLSQHLPDTTISLISTPLAPNNPASKSFPWLMTLYTELMSLSFKENEKVIWMGDSSGANIILCLVMESLRIDKQKKTSTPRPISVMAISPSTDLTRANPGIDAIAPNDPLLSPTIIKQTAAAYLSSSISPKNPIVSPIYGDLKSLRRSGVRVHGVTAGYDVLSADGIVFRKGLKEHGVRGEWLHWEKQMHCFVLTAGYGLREGKEGIEWIVDVLRRDLT